MASKYGMMIFYYKSIGLYQSDIGIIGKFTQFGVLYVLANFLIIRKIFIIKVKPQYTFIKFWAVTLTIGTITGGTFGSPSTIVVIASVLYFIDVSNYEWKQDLTETL
jgi:hypothetical protein